MSILLYAGIGLAVTGCVVAFEADVNARPDFWPALRAEAWDYVFPVVMALMAAGVATHLLTRRCRLFSRPRWRSAAALALAALVVVSSFTYLYARRTADAHYAHAHDTFHYLLGPKYFEELGYMALYDCALAAVPEEMTRVKGIRDLESYRLKSRGSVDVVSCRSRFTEQRWAEFEKDVSLFREALGRAGFDKALRDFGYNGTPFHAVVAGALANSFELSYRTWNLAALVDGLGLLLMLLVISLSFGWRLGLVFAVFFLTSFVDRGAVTGGSFLRVQWMVALGVGIAALKVRYFSTAAVFLVIAAMLNVFPLLFLLGACLSMAGRVVRARAIPAEIRRFIIAGLIATLLCGVVSVSTGYGLDGYRMFFENMALHADGAPLEDGRKAARMPGYGVGLKFNFMYRDRLTEAGPRITRDARSEEYLSIEPLVLGVAWVVTLFSALVATRVDEVEAAATFGVCSFFCLLGTVGYYFACAALITLVFHRFVRGAGGALMLLLWFAVNVAVWLGVQLVDSTPLAYNTVTSALWTVYLLALLIYLGVVTNTFRDLSYLLARPQTAAT